MENLMELINIKIDISIITHEGVKEHPFVNVSLNGFPQFGEILDKDTLVEIDVEIQDDTQNFLTIEYHNKDAKQDVVLGEDGSLLKDKRVEINSISFDDIELDFFLLMDQDVFKYVPSDPAGTSASGFDATKLSWNGASTLTFKTPVYVWLLENL